MVLKPNRRPRLRTVFILAFFGFFTACTLQVDTGEFGGAWRLNDDGYQSGPGSVSAGSGNHTLYAAATPIDFNLAGDGVVTLGVEHDGISANAANQQISLLTVPIDFDPGGYKGHWAIDYVRSPLNGGSDFNPGSERLQLVPSNRRNSDGSTGAQYRLSIGAASSALNVNVRAGGSLSYSFTDSATLDTVRSEVTGVVRFNNIEVSILEADEDGTPWRIRQVFPGNTKWHQGDKVLVLVPGVEYLFQANGHTETFQIDSMCSVNTITLDMNGEPFIVQCVRQLFSAGNMFVADRSVKVFSPQGQQLADLEIEQLNQAGSLAFNFTKNWLWVTDRRRNRIVALSGSGDLIKVSDPIPGEGGTWGIAVHRNGEIYVAGDSGGVHVLDANGGYLRKLFSPIESFAIQAALSHDDGKLFVTDSSGFNKGVHTWRTADGKYLGIAAETIDRLHVGGGLAVVGDKHFYVGDSSVTPSTGSVKLFSLDEGYIKTLAPAIHAPVAIAIDADGIIWVTDTNNFVPGAPKILGYDPDGPLVRTIGTFPELAQPTGLAIYLP